MRRRTIPTARITQAGIGIRRGLAGFVAAATLFPCAVAQQPQCLNGILSLPGDVNGRIEVCGTLASQVPGLQNQLNDMAKSLIAQQGQTRDLVRAMKDLNRVGKDIGTDRQIELLQSLSKQLSTDQVAGQQKTQSQISDLADRLDELKDLLLENLGNPRLAEKTNEAVNGPVGNAIAQLDLAKAKDLLQDIQAQLKAIDSKVDAVQKGNIEIQKTTTEIKRTLDQQAADEAQRRKEGEEQYKAAVEKNNQMQAKQQRDRENDPNRFARVSWTVIKSGSVWSLRASVISQDGGGRPMTQPKFQIAFRKTGEKPWLLNFTERQVVEVVDMWSQMVDEIGDTAVVCLSAQDPRSNLRREWTQKYAIELPQGSPYIVRANLIPAGDPTLKPEDGAPCDGVTDAREPMTQLQLKDAQMLSGGFGDIHASAMRPSFPATSKWRLEIIIGPKRVSQKLWDVQVQVVMRSNAGREWPVPLSNGQMFSHLENRFALLDEMGNGATVCLTARTSPDGQAFRTTAWFKIETSEGQYKDGESAEKASFVTTREPAVTPASNAPCQ